MRTSERLRFLKKWIEENLCEGRIMKAPAPNMDMAQFVTQQPRCYLGWQPMRPDTTGMMQADPINVCPGILVLPKASVAKYVAEKRFDRNNKIFRPQELGQTLSVDMLFSVYEPGVRLPGFVQADGSLDLDRLTEGTEQGLYTLMDWMDDCIQELLGQKFIPHTDLFVDESTLAYSLYSEQNYVADKRPIYYGFVTVTFFCYAEEGQNRGIEDFLQ